MKLLDSLGNRFGEGDMVLVNLGNNWVEGVVKEINSGGESLAMVGPGAPRQLKPDGMTILVTCAFGDALPGDKHKSVYRINDPERSRIVPIGN